MKNALIALGLTMASTMAADAVPQTLQAGPDTGAGNDVVFLGSTATNTLELLPECNPNPPPPYPGNLCAVLEPQPATTSYLVSNPTRTLPIAAGAAHSWLCVTLKSRGSFTFTNSTSVRQPSAKFSSIALVTVENEVLDDPALINPLTGQPFGGRIEFSSFLHSESRQLEANETAHTVLNGTGHCDVELSRYLLQGGFDLSPEQAAQFFAVPMTIRFGFNGDARIVARANIQYRVFAYGDRTSDAF